MVSGRRRRHSSRASSPSLACPTTSKPASVRAWVSTRRMRPESSATTTRVAGGAAVIGSGSGQLAAGEDALGVEQDDEAVVDLGDGLDRRAASGRDRVELAVVDGEDLLNVVDDDAGHVGGRLNDDDLAALVALLGHETETGG